jgi:3-hydroxyacyl-CoA dehydrogenase
VCPEVYGLGVNNTLTVYVEYQVNMTNSSTVYALLLVNNTWVHNHVWLRVIGRELLEAIRIFEQGIARIKEIDEMARLAFDHPMGPFKLMDLIGLDTILHISKYLDKNLGETHYKPPVTLVKLVLSGYLGDPRIKKGSRGGWYSYYYKEGGE